MKPTVDIDLSKSEASLFCPDVTALRLWIERTLESVKFDQASAEIAIRVVNKRESERFNHQYRSKAKPTNVLSFKADIPEFIESNLLGDLVVCSSVVEDEAKDQGKKHLDHWAHMVIHGTLHLLGYDHINERDADIMENLEREILRGLNIADPY